MEFWTICMLLFSILWFFIFFSIVGIIRCEGCCKIFVRTLRWLRPVQADIQSDIGAVFHRGTDPENGPNIELLLTNVASESHRTHKNMATCSSV